MRNDKLCRENTKHFPAGVRSCSGKIGLDQILDECPVGCRPQSMSNKKDAP